MSGEYRRNHYVPVWYQKRFIPRTAASQELLYLDLSPGTLTDPRGVIHQRFGALGLGIVFLNKTYTRQSCPGLNRRKSNACFSA